MNSEPSTAEERSTGHSARVNEERVWSGACFAFVALLALLSAIPRGDETAAPEASAARASQAAPAVVVRAADHRKQLFDERRNRYDEAWHAKAQGEDGSASVALNRSERSSTGEHR